LKTATCHRCKSKVSPQAVTCPHCGTELKAFGHPGIPLHRAKENEYLCKSCTYDADDTCTYPQRPFAKECTLYQNIEQRKQDFYEQQLIKRQEASFGNWLKRNQSLILILALLLICFVIVLSQYL
jgi:C4-type Zn-finger protein